ncbi:MULTISPECIES: hypothetical protein [Rhodomicrobium]|uniref:hypothetical protein n=1 Tax=Rhodomicrobium TaxID=1068 RepID=UPI000F73D589|nr:MULTISPECIES: hypothetical protein [Rhodomicrobium]
MTIHRKGLNLDSSQISIVFFALLIIAVICNARETGFSYGLLLLTTVILPMLVLTWWDTRQVTSQNWHMLLIGFSQNVIFVFFLFVATTSILASYYGINELETPQELEEIASFHRKLFRALPFPADDLLKDIIASIISTLIGGFITKRMLKG